MVDPLNLLPPTPLSGALKAPPPPVSVSLLKHQTFIMVIMASKSFRMAQKLLSFVSLWDVRLGLLPGRGHSDISRNNLCPTQWPLKFRAQIQNKSASSN